MNRFRQGYKGLGIISSFLSRISTSEASSSFRLYPTRSTQSISTKTMLATQQNNVLPSAQKKLNKERDTFIAFFQNHILPDATKIMKEHSLPDNGLAYVQRMLEETVPGGKMNRGLSVPSALESILKRPLTSKEAFHAALLGWSVELLQAFFLISDDIMDSSITRRGKPCWYRQQGVGMNAINDAFIVESLIYKLIKLHLRDHPAYVDILDLLHDVTFQTELGQLMDLITAPEDDVDLSRFSISKHAYIVEYKTAYYSFYLPIAMAMRLAGITSQGAYTQAKNVLLPLGEYFQVQDDFLDCYGAPEVIGKIGTDIEDNKCSWLINQALSRASHEQHVILEENYGRKDPENVARVKQVYKELDIEGIFHAYENESYERIMGLIRQVDESLIPQSLFITFLNRIYKRQV